MTGIKQGDTMTNALAKTNTLIPPALEVPEHGEFQVEPFSTDRIVVRTSSLLVKGMLYAFSAQMMKHSSGDWYFIQETVQCPKLSPKLKEETLLRVAELARAYMKNHPEVMDILAVRSWKNDFNHLDYQLSSEEYDQVRNQQQLETAQSRVAESVRNVERLQRDLSDLMEKQPAGATYPPVHEARSRYLKKLLMQKEADAWTPDNDDSSSSPS